MLCPRALRACAPTPNKCHVPLRSCRAPPPPAPPCAQGGRKDGRGDIFIVSDTGCPRLSYFTRRAKEASLCYAAAGQAAEPGEGKDGRKAAGCGCVHAWVRACKRACVCVCVCTHSQQARFLPSLSRGATAERLPAAFKRVCFSTPAPNSIRTNCIWERGWAFWWGVFGLLLKKLGWQFAYHYPACLSSSQPGQDLKSRHGQQSSSPEFP